MIFLLSAVAWQSIYDMCVQQFAFLATTAFILGGSIASETGLSAKSGLAEYRALNEISCGRLQRERYMDRKLWLQKEKFWQHTQQAKCKKAFDC